MSIIHTINGYFRGYFDIFLSSSTYRLKTEGNRVLSSVIPFIPPCDLIVESTPFSSSKKVVKNVLCNILSHSLKKLRRYLLEVRVVDKYIILSSSQKAHLHFHLSHVSYGLKLTSGLTLNRGYAFS